MKVVQSRQTFLTLTLCLLGMNFTWIFNLNNIGARIFFSYKSPLLFYKREKINMDELRRVVTPVFLSGCVWFFVESPGVGPRFMWTAFGANSRAFPEPFLIFSFDKCTTNTRTGYPLLLRSRLVCVSVPTISGFYAAIMKLF